MLSALLPNDFLSHFLNWLCIVLNISPWLCPRSVLQEVLDQKDTFQSLRQDVLPYLVRSQLVSSI